LAVEPLEGAPPGGLDAGRILEVLEVQILDERQVRDRQLRQRVITLTLTLTLTLAF